MYFMQIMHLLHQSDTIISPNHHCQLFNLFINFLLQIDQFLRVSTIVLGHFRGSYLWTPAKIPSQIRIFNIH